MYRLLSRWLAAGGVANPSPTPTLDALRQLFQIHPLQLYRYLEEVWAAGGFLIWTSTGPPISRPEYMGSDTADQLRAIYQLPPELRRAAEPSYLSIASGTSSAAFPSPAPDPTWLAVQNQPWEHLMYAYLIENTGVLPIFRRVIELYALGEVLEVPSDEGRMWLRSTEELFYRDPPPFHVSSLTSFARPDLEASRRNSYWRMFGMDLNHGLSDGRPYPYVKAAAANTGFVDGWEAFLREVWSGYLNRMNSSGENSSDPEAVANLAYALEKMLRVRRERGNLTREEFFFVSALSWFHATLEDDTPIVVDLKSQAKDPAERLAKIGQRVGISAHPKSRNFFMMAEQASTILRFIELQQFSDPAGAKALFDDTTPEIRDDVLTVINHWSAATGRDLKLRRPREALRTPQRPVPRPAVMRPVTMPPVRQELEVATNGTHESL